MEQPVLHDDDDDDDKNNHNHNNRALIFQSVTE
jgi:hypothetical protein